MSADFKDFEQFMKRRSEAAGAYVRGDPAPLNSLVARALPATFFGPNGGFELGAAQVSSTYRNGAAMFGADGESAFEILQMAASDDVAYWVGIQRAQVNQRGSDESKSMNLRVTEIFRREEGEWKLVHRHADMLALNAQGVSRK